MQVFGIRFSSVVGQLFGGATCGLVNVTGLLNIVGGVVFITMAVQLMHTGYW